VLVDLRGGGTPPDDDEDELGSGDLIAGGEQVGEQERAVDLAAA